MPINVEVVVQISREVDFGGGGAEPLLPIPGTNFRPVLNKTLQTLDEQLL
jgi:hypothetical protein